MRNLSLKQLRSIQEIAARGKIINAANALSLTPPAVTIQLRQAEEEFGLTLFDRTTDGMRPTAAGLAVVEAAQSIEERLRVLDDQIDAIKGVRAGSLKLGVVSTAKYFAPRLMAAFIKQYPAIEMRLSIGNRAEIIAMLKNHDDRRGADGTACARTCRFAPSAFGDHPLVIIAAPDHPAGQGARHHQGAHRGGNLPHSRTRLRNAHLAGDLSVATSPGRIDDLGVEMGSNETIKQAVMAGLGIAFISAHTIAMEVEFGRLVMLDVDGMPIRRQWFGVMRADRTLSPAMATFQDFLMRQGADASAAAGKALSGARRKAAERSAR